MPFTPYPKDTDIYICNGVPLDPTYEHTIYQRNVSSQFSTFSPYIKRTFPANSYQRVNKNSLRIATQAEKVYDCNYLIFRNSSFGTKYFYAFITEVNYINDNTTEIVYEIDVMQTYYFDFKLNSVFVEREHTLTDNVNENFIDEGIAVSDYMVENVVNKYYNYLESTLTNSLMYIYVWFVPNGDRTFQSIANHNGDGEVTGLVSMTSTGRGHFSSGYYIGCDNIQEPVQGTSASLQTLTAKNVGKIIMELIDAGCTITAIQLVPGIMPTNWSQVALSENQSFSDNLGHNYTPKNKKLLKYPYKKILVSNNVGAFKEYKWESFGTTSGQGWKVASFNITYTRMPKGFSHCYPTDYAGLTVENGLTLDVFPTYTWSEDSFATWWAQNGSSALFSLVTGSITSTLNTIVSSAGGDFSQAMGIQRGFGAASNLLNFASNLIKADDTPDAGRGEIGGNISTVAENRIGFSYYALGIRPEEARVIDDFFSMYGYKIGRVKRPNIYASAEASLRPVWNYIKTRNCTLAGTNVHTTDSNIGMPATAEKKVCEIFDNGITFWLNISSVGQYTLDNSPRA